MQYPSRARKPACAVHRGRAFAVMEARALAEGLAAFPTVFPEIYRATVSAGEQSGHLDAVLERMADYTENRQILQQKIRNAMIYPVLLTFVCLGIVALLLAYVVPEVVRVFEAGDQVLPLMTRILIAMSDFLRAWWWLLIAVAVVACGDSAAGCAIRPRVFARTPSSCACRSSGALPAATMQRASPAPSPSWPRVPCRSSRRCGSRRRSSPTPPCAAPCRTRPCACAGCSHRALLGASKLFPPMLVHLIASGETSGELEAMLERAADNQERELDGVVNTAVGILGPVMILLMGGFVFVIVIALLLPIFQLNQLVR